jgi:Fe-S-cluster-containing dehydrogenase component
MEKKPVQRRDFLKVLAFGSAVFGGIRLVRSTSASERGESSPYRWGMVIDRVLEAAEVGDKPVFLPRPCMHCENAPCVDACMVGASYHRSDGIVMMDYDKCIGCRYCEVACPYGGRAFNWVEFTGPNPAVPEWGQPEVPRRPRGVVEKCSFCYHRIDRGLKLGLKPGVDADATPACVVACPMGARKFGDLNDPASEVSKVLKQHSYFQLREDLGTSPRVFYLPPDEEVTA